MFGYQAASVRSEQGGQWPGSKGGGSAGFISSGKEKRKGSQIPAVRTTEWLLHPLLCQGAVQTGAPVGVAVNLTAAVGAQLVQRDVGQIDPLLLSGLNEKVSRETGEVSS